MRRRVLVAVATCCMIVPAQLPALQSSLQDDGKNPLVALVDALMSAKAAMKTSPGYDGVDCSGLRGCNWADQYSGTITLNAKQGSGDDVTMYNVKIAVNQGAAVCSVTSYAYSRSEQIGAAYYKKPARPVSMSWAKPATELRIVLPGKNIPNGSYSIRAICPDFRKGSWLWNPPSVDLQDRESKDFKNLKGAWTEDWEDEGKITYTVDLQRTRDNPCEADRVLMEKFSKIAANVAEELRGKSVAVRPLFTPLMKNPVVANVSAQLNAQTPELATVANSVTVTSLAEQNSGTLGKIITQQQSGATQLLNAYATAEANGNPNPALGELVWSYMEFRDTEERLELALALVAWYADSAKKCGLR